MAGAVQYAHNHNIIHRDLKPANILIGTHQELRLSDFGIAVLSQTGRTTLNPAYGAGGTPFYMAPEQCRGKPEKASDQYALAIMAYEWLCGSPPFTEGNAINIQYQHTHEPVPPLHERCPLLPAMVEEVLLTALAKDPKQRYPSVLAFADALEHAAAPQTSQHHLQTDEKSAHPQQPRGVSVQPMEQESVSPTQQRHSMPPREPTRVLTLTRRTVLVGLSLTGLALAGGGIAWWILTPHPIYTYRGHSDAVESVAWSPDGKRLASASADKTVQVWNADGSGQPFIYKGHSSAVNSVAWSPDGKRLASGSDDETVQVWSVG